MLRFLFALLALVLAVPAGADGMRLADPDVLKQLQSIDRVYDPLPRDEALHERGAPRPLVAFGAVPPDGAVDTPAEYEANDGIFIRWTNGHTALQTQMIVPLTTANPPARVFIVVDDPAHEAAVTADLQAAGADTDQLWFLHADTDSVWIRDYGPRFISKDGLRAIVDHTYNRSFRPLDNGIPDAVAMDWNEPGFDIPLVHGGGNFHLFANGDAFMTSLILDENPGLSAQDVEDYYLAYQSLDLTITDPLPSSFDSTQHIDMWMLPVRDQEVIVGEYDPGEFGGVPNQVTEDTVADMLSRGYTVHRTDGWSASGSHYTYTNSVIVNQMVLICEFNGYPAENAEALSVYQTAFPDKTIVQVDCSNIIHSAGAIHCIVMHVPHTAILDRDGFETD